MKKLLILVCSLVFLTSCLPGHSLNPTITPSLTPTATSTKIPTATPTNTPTVIPTITPTPTPQLPVTLDKPLPEVSDAIGVENASQLNLIANYERFDIGKTLLKLTPDGNYYFIVSDGGAVPLGGIDVYDSNTKQIIRHYSINQRQIYDRSVHHNIYLSNDLQMSKDGQRFMVRTNDNSLSVFDDAGKNIFSYTPPPKIDSNPALSPNGRYLAIDLCSVCFDWTGGQMAFKVFNLDTGEMIYERISIKKNGEVYGSNPLFSPDGKFLATRIGSMEYIWDTSDWSEISNIDLGVSDRKSVV